MKKAIWLILPVILFLWGVSAAEYYRYTDQEGHIRYTDDLSRVPPDQRPDVKSYEESMPDENTPQAPDEDTPRAPEVRKTVEPKQNISIDLQAEQIQKKKSDLSKEYEMLTKEKARLEEARKDAKLKNEIEKVNLKISELNDKIYQWEQKRNALNAELDAYNARVIEEAKKKQPTPASP